MRFQGALVREQGITFGIIVVKPHVLHDSSLADSMRQLGVHAFGLVPIVLMTQNAKGIPTYQGRDDIVRFLARVPMRAIPWKQYTLN